MVDISEFFPDRQQFKTISAEAEFGFSEMKAALTAAPHNANVLEIGSGTGLLAAKITQAFPQVSLDAVEPLGSGFTAFEEAMQRIANAHEQIHLHRDTAEEFDPGETRYDLIFSINVFEHIGDWRQALRNLSNLLKPSGNLIIICPNYSVPYESHFGIPLVLGYERSRRIFAKRIDWIEEISKAEGLWDSLNFIKSTELARSARDQGLTINFDRGIMSRMLNRLATDEQFRKRQGGIAGVAKLAQQLGAGHLTKAIPIRFTPYMKAIVTNPR